MSEDVIDDPLPDEVAETSEDAPEEPKPEGVETEDDSEEETEEETEEESEDEEPEKPKRKRPGKNARERMRLQAENQRIAAENEAYRRLLTEQQVNGFPDPAAPVEAPPNQDDFENYEDFVVAKAKYEVRQEIQKEQSEAEARRREEEERTQGEAQMKTLTERLDAGRDKYDDFDEVVFDPAVPITTEMTRVLAMSDAAADVAYHLGMNPDEARRIAGLDSVGIAREIGRIEERLSRPVPKKATAAPPPTPRVTKGSPPERDPTKMSFAEYEAYRMGG